MMNEQQSYLFDQIRTSQTGVQTYFLLRSKLVLYAVSNAFKMLQTVGQNLVNTLWPRLVPSSNIKGIMWTML